MLTTGPMCEVSDYDLFESGVGTELHTYEERIAFIVLWE